MFLWAVSFVSLACSLGFALCMEQQAPLRQLRFWVLSMYVRPLDKLPSWPGKMPATIGGV